MVSNKSSKTWPPQKEFSWLISEGSLYQTKLKDYFPWKRVINKRQNQQNIVSHDQGRLWQDSGCFFIQWYLDTLCIYPSTCIKPYHTKQVIKIKAIFHILSNTHSSPDVYPCQHSSVLFGLVLCINHTLLWSTTVWNCYVILRWHECETLQLKYMTSVYASMLCFIIMKGKTREAIHMAYNER